MTRRFETAFAAAPIGMAMVGLDGRFLRCNQALADLTGYAEDELTAMTFQDITHPADLDLDLAHVRAADRRARPPATRWRSAT